MSHPSPYYFLVSTTTATPGPAGIAGHVMSRHRTLAAARAADVRLQRDVRRGNGSGSYLPTRVLRLVGSLRRMDSVDRHQVLGAVA